jgi:hypothetical protein
MFNIIWPMFIPLRGLYPKNAKPRTKKIL